MHHRRCDDGERDGEAPARSERQSHDEHYDLVSDPPGLTPLRRQCRERLSNDSVGGTVSDPEGLTLAYVSSLNGLKSVLRS